jgi:Rieske Fe-S protein
MEPRRSFLSKLVAAGSALIGVAVAGLAGAVTVPRKAGTTRRWRKVASMFDLPPAGPLAATLTERHTDGWHETRKSMVVFLDKEGDGYRAFSAVCSHLGCSVAWNAAEGHYRCPCHGGTYSRDGHVVSGPPPQGLTRLPVRLNPDTAELEVEL